MPTQPLGSAQFDALNVVPCAVSQEYDLCVCVLKAERRAFRSPFSPPACLAPMRGARCRLPQTIQLATNNAHQNTMLVSHSLVTFLLCARSVHSSLITSALPAR